MNVVVVLVAEGFPTDSSGEVEVFGHDGDPLGMERAKLGVLEEPDDIGLRGLLEGEKSRRLEAEL